MNGEVPFPFTASPVVMAANAGPTPVAPAGVSAGSSPSRPAPPPGPEGPLPGYSAAPSMAAVSSSPCSMGSSFLGLSYWKPCTPVLPWIGLLGSRILMSDWTSSMSLQVARPSMGLFLNFWLAVTSRLLLASCSLPTTRALGAALEKLLLEDLEIYFRPLFAKILLALEKVPSFCFSLWQWLKSWMHSSQFTRCCFGSQVASSLP